MELTPVSRSAVSDAVFGQLVDAILAGRMAPDETLPSERELAESFQVNRHAVREALKRVQQAGLVRISQGGRTRVLDWREHAGLDVLSGLAAAGAVPALRLLHDIAVMRAAVAADAARLCAVAATPAQRDAVVAAAAAYPGDGDAFATYDADLAFWRAVIEGSGNVAYLLSLNTLVAGFGDIGWEVIADLGLDLELADRGSHVELARRIAARDDAGAHQLAEDLLGRLVAALAAALPDQES